MEYNVKSFKLFTIVVTYNGAEWIERCISSLLDANVENHSIVVIDNGSQDDTVKIIQRDFPVVELVMPGKNLGFGKANNLGINKALNENADFVFLLNQDAWINKKTFPELFRCSKNFPDYGIISPLQLAADGTFDDQFNKYYSPTLSPTHDQIVEVGFVNASGWFLTVDCLRTVGGFSPLFFHYGEDVDYCNRVKYHGYNVGVAKECSYIHDRGNRSALEIPLHKQKQQMYITNLVRLANIKRSVFLNIAINSLRLVQKLFDNNQNNENFSKSVYLPAFVNSLKTLRMVRKYRKHAKRPGAFFKIH